MFIATLELTQTIFQFKHVLKDYLNIFTTNLEHTLIILVQNIVCLTNLELTQRILRNKEYLKNFSEQIFRTYSNNNLLARLTSSSLKTQKILVIKYLRKLPQF